MSQAVLAQQRHEATGKLDVEDDGCMEAKYSCLTAVAPSCDVVALAESAVLQESARFFLKLSKYCVCAAFQKKKQTSSISSQSKKLHLIKLLFMSKAGWFFLKTEFNGLNNRLTKATLN